MTSVGSFPNQFMSICTQFIVDETKVCIVTGRIQFSKSDVSDQYPYVSRLHEFDLSHEVEINFSSGFQREALAKRKSASAMNRPLLRNEILSDGCNVIDFVSE